MAKSKEDVKYATAQAKLSEDEALRVAYKHGTPLEAGKIAESEPVELFRSAKKLSAPAAASEEEGQAHRDAKTSAAAAAGLEEEEEEEDAARGDGGGV